MCRCGLTQALCLRVPELRHVSGVCARGVAFVAFALALSLGFSGLASAPIVPRWVHRGTVTAGLWPSLPGEPRASVLGLVRQGPLTWSGPNLSFESLQAGYPSVLWDAGVYKMWYFGCTPSYFCQIGYATSQDGRTWTRYGPVLGPSLPQDSQIAAYPEVVADTTDRTTGSWPRPAPMARPGRNSGCRSISASPDLRMATTR